MVNSCRPFSLSTRLLNQAKQYLLQTHSVLAELRQARFCMLQLIYWLNKQQARMERVVSGPATRSKHAPWAPEVSVLFVLSARESPLVFPVHTGSGTVEIGDAALALELRGCLLRSSTIFFAGIPKH